MRWARTDLGSCAGGSGGPAPSVAEVAGESRRRGCGSLARCLSVGAHGAGRCRRAVTPHPPPARPPSVTQLPGGRACKSRRAVLPRRACCRRASSLSRHPMSSGVKPRPPARQLGQCVPGARQRQGGPAGGRRPALARLRPGQSGQLRAAGRGAGSVCGWLDPVARPRALGETHRRPGRVLTSGDPVLTVGETRIAVTAGAA